jgi:uncharacterized cupredoxin-like copper-binding protein
MPRFTLARLVALKTLTLLTAGVLVLAACDDGGDVRTVTIDAGLEACTPATVEVPSGRNINLRVINNSGSVVTVRDGDGRLAPMEIAPASEGETFFLIPQGSGVYTLNCAIAGVGATTIRLVAGTPGSPEAANATLSPAEAYGTIAVSLADFTLTPSQDAVPAGRYNVIATNVSATSTHEVVVLQVQPDGNLVSVAQIAPIPPQQGGAMLISLGPGTYRFACQVQIGESGSTVDHYQQGMWADVFVPPPDEETPN